MKKIAILLLAGLAAACGDTEVGDPEAETPENVLMHDTLPESAVVEADTAGALTVVLNEWRVRVARDTIEAVEGPTVLRARNNGTYAHRLAIEGQGEEWTSDEIAPGEWGVLEAELRPGTYDVYCPVEDEHGVHRDMGMIDRLVVR